MLMTSIVSYLHFVGIIGLFVTLSMEKILFKKEIDLPTAKKIGTIDAAYGISAVVILTTGLLKMFLYGKGSAYYLHNHIMWGKLLLFTVVGILSIIPTIYFMQWRKNIKAGEDIVITDRDYKRISMFIHLELVLAIFIPLFATLMARGFGYVAGN